VRREGAFEIFDSSGGWSFLFGKLLQSAFGTVHDYKRDVVEIAVGDAKATLANQREEARWRKSKLATVAGTPDAFKGVLSFAKYPAGHVPFKKSSKQVVFDTGQVSDCVCTNIVEGAGLESGQGAVEVERVASAMASPPAR
jgi:hypothetical protein